MRSQNIVIHLSSFFLLVSTAFASDIGAAKTFSLLPRGKRTDKTEFLANQNGVDLLNGSSSCLDYAHRVWGGASCQDSNPHIFLTMGVGAVLETAALLGSLCFGKILSEEMKTVEVGGIDLVQWVSVLLVIFASSAFGSLLDGGLSAATKQVLDPTAVPGDSNWYASLKRPSWNPPGWVFPIMWLLVSKPTQALAVSKLLTATKSSSEIPWKTLAVYCAYLSHGDVWNKVFFGLQCTGRGAAVITVFFGLLLLSTYLFYGVDPNAGKLMLPTCAWVFVASCLNWNIYLNN